MPVQEHRRAQQVNEIDELPGIALMLIVISIAAALVYLLA